MVACSDESQSKSNTDVSSEILVLSNFVAGVGSTHLVVNFNTVQDDILTRLDGETLWVFESLEH